MSQTDDRPPVIGAILAGGASSRMGRPKATIPLAGRPLITYPLEAAAAAGLEPVAVAKPDSALPELDCAVIEEPAEPRHPLAGLVAALRASGGRPVIAIACDMPFVEPAMLEALAAAGDPLVVGEAAGRLQPFPGRYGLELVVHLERALARQLPLTTTVADGDPRVLDEEELRAFGDPELLCMSVNDEADLARAEAELASRRSTGG
jgi:molybdenum cofactor guanylyltransferase